MKKILFTALIAIYIVSSAFAQDEQKINYRVLNAFTTEFNEATDVNWTSKPEFDKACFNLEGKKLSAFYTCFGEKIGTTQEVSFETLPSKAKNCIAKKYNDYSVKATILFESDRESSYYVAAENNFQSVVLKVVGGYVTIFKKKSKTNNKNSTDKPMQLAAF